MQLTMSNAEAINMIQDAHAVGMSDEAVLEALSEAGINGMRAFHLLWKALSGIEREEND